MNASDILLILGICTLALAGFLVPVVGSVIGLTVLALGMIFFSFALADRRPGAGGER